MPTAIMTKVIPNTLVINIFQKNKLKNENKRRLSNQNAQSAQTPVTKGKEIFEGEKIVRRLEVRVKKKKVTMRKEVIPEKEIVQEYIYPTSFWFSLVVLFGFNLFLITTWFVGQSNSILIIFCLVGFFLLLLPVVYCIKNLNQNTKSTESNQRKTPNKTNYYCCRKCQK